jgi:hypothetical protein
MMRAALVLLLLAVGGSAVAHGTSRSYLTLAPAAGGYAGDWQVAVPDLAVASPLDADQDGRVTWGEVLAQEAAIGELASSQLAFSDSSGACAMRVAPLQIDWHGEIAYVSTPFVLSCGGAADSLKVQYRFLEDLDASHRMLARVSGPQGVRVLVVTPGVARDLGGAHESAGKEFLRYVREGTHHILIGYDHLAFLFALLLPAVLRRARRHWLPVPRLREAVLETLRIVSAFTLSHSVTLAVSALGWWRPPAAIVEIAIALSVAAAALLNFRPAWQVRGAWLAFGFGFIHGFGFANALSDLGLARGEVVAPLLGFNLGVELGQLWVVATVLPVLFALRKRPSYARRWLPGASAAIVVAAVCWTVSRWPA